MPYATDLTKAPLYSELGEGPRNVDEYDANLAKLVENPIGKRGEPTPTLEDVAAYQKKLDEFLNNK